MTYGYMIGEEWMVKHVTPERILVDKQMRTADIDLIGGVVNDQNETNIAVP